MKMMVGKPGGGRFAFVDAGETARILGIDRVTLDQWVRDGRIKPHRGVGREAFFRTSEEDIRTWFRQLAPDGYERNKNNAEHTIKKLQYLVSLIEEAQGRE